MKQFAAALLALILALACTAALAETYGQPILFRGIPWGTTLEELRGQVGSGNVSHFSDTVKMMIEDDTNNPYANKDYALGVWYTSEAKAAIGDVAGYELDDVLVLFTYPLGEDGLPVKDDEAQTAFFAARYFLGSAIGVYKTNAERFADLTNKLTSLYGEPESASDELVVWRGAEGTLLSLQDNGEDAMVTYASEIGETMMQALLDAETAAEDAFAANTNGL